MARKKQILTNFDTPLHILLTVTPPPPHTHKGNTPTQIVHTFVVFICLFTPTAHLVQLTCVLISTLPSLTSAKKKKKLKLKIFIVFFYNYYFIFIFPVVTYTNTASGFIHKPAASFHHQQQQQQLQQTQQSQIHHDPHHHNMAENTPEGNFIFDFYLILKL